jgi:ribosomal protein S2
MIIPLKKITFKNIGNLGVQYGGNYTNLNSFFSEWVFGKRYGKLIIDLRYTLIEWKKTIYFLSNIVSLRGKILYTDNFCEINNYILVLNYFYLVGQFFLNGIFTRNFISNFRYIYFEVIKFFCNKKYYSINKDNLLKKEEKFSQHNLLGLKNLRRPPNVVFTPDSERNFWLVKSSIQVRLPVISISNPCFFLNGMFLSIPGSTQRIISIPYFIFILINIFLRGLLLEFKLFFNLINKKKIFKEKSKKFKLISYYKTRFNKKIKKEYKKLNDKKRQK